VGYGVGLIFWLVAILLWSKPSFIRWVFDQIRRDFWLQGYWARHPGRYEWTVSGLQLAVPPFLVLNGIAWMLWQAGIN
jgi:hypothetical protein